jgi:leucyl-tRNA---protein transferase
MEVEIIHDRIPIDQIEPAVFDQLMAKGWRFLGNVMLRHNIIVYADEITLTIAVRIALTGFEFSKSQRKLLKQHGRFFTHKVQAIALTPEKNELFLKHCQRFRYGNHYTSLDTFITNESHIKPVQGYEIEVYDGGKLVACSYFHLGANSMSGTYCYFDPSYNKHSLGHYTMLLEIELAKTLGKDYYYSGYVHDKPSQFDYKLNFNNLEMYNWVTEVWRPCMRMPT